jgi:hypothetical protein
MVDVNRLAITGGRAGGYVALCAQVFLSCLVQVPVTMALVT